MPDMVLMSKKLTKLIRQTCQRGSFKGEKTICQLIDRDFLRKDFEKTVMRSRVSFSLNVYTELYGYLMKLESKCSHLH